MGIRVVEEISAAEYIRKRLISWRGMGVKAFGPFAAVKSKLLFHRYISNREAREFLMITSRHAVKRLLTSINLQYSGTKKQPNTT
jgi:hypothetical protein